MQEIHQSTTEVFAFPVIIALIPVVAGIVLFVFGWAHLKIVAFPIAFLFLMIPIPAIIFNQIAFPLQLQASRFGEWAIATAGIPVLREGNVLILAHTSLEVAEACSGIRSLVSLITLGIVYGYFMDSRAWVRTLIVLSAIPVAIIANGARVAGTGMAGQAHCYYGHYYAAQAMYLAGGEYWQKWWPAARDELIARQSSGGGWLDNHTGGLDATGMALIALQMPKRYLPIFQR